MEPLFKHLKDIASDISQQLFWGTSASEENKASFRIKEKKKIKGIVLFK